MRYSRSPEDGDFITLDDLAEFVAEMRGYRRLPGHTVVRGSTAIEFDLRDGPRLMRITADPDSTPERAPVTEQEDMPLP
jgi:hypothetical protein